MALSDFARTPAYHNAMVEAGRKLGWQPGARRYSAEDQCVSQTYLELYLIDHDPAMLGPTQSNCDYILDHPGTNDLRTSSPGSQDRWNGSDRLFMAPPVWALLSRATGDLRYLDFMDREWRTTADLLYDKDEHLFFHDSADFDKRGSNGGKVFWSADNGCVVSGLARVLEFMPRGFSRRRYYEQQFAELAAKILALQQSDGLWRSSLLDPAASSRRETGGSALCTFAFAWGVNHGLLDRERYEPAARKSWAALVGFVTPEGKMAIAQPADGGLESLDPSKVELFNAGAFLLAGSQMCRMARVRYDFP
jgi:rhamnogalacturonyl hydrolase YesR